MGPIISCVSKTNTAKLKIFRYNLKLPLLERVQIQIFL